MGIELELIILLFIQLLGTSFFSRFEAGTAVWKKILKWITLDAITIGLFYFIGHFALLFPAVILLIGLSIHFYFCRKHGIDPIKATPRKKYYELRGWVWEE